MRAPDLATRRSEIEGNTSPLENPLYRLLLNFGTWGELGWSDVTHESDYGGEGKGLLNCGLSVFFTVAELISALSSSPSLIG